MSASRKEFLRFVGAGSVAAGCPVDLSLLVADAPRRTLTESTMKSATRYETGNFSRNRLSQRVTTL